MSEFKPMSHEQMLHHIEWPLLDCLQALHLSYRPQSCDMAGDYRYCFAEELERRRSLMSAPWAYDLTFHSMMRNRDFLKQAPRYAKLFEILTPCQKGFGQGDQFAGALTRGKYSGKAGDEEIFALIAAAVSGEAQEAISIWHEANMHFESMDARKMEYLFLVIGDVRPLAPGAPIAFDDSERFQAEFAAYHQVVETFEINRVMNIGKFDEQRQPIPLRWKQYGQATVVRYSNEVTEGR